MDELVRLRQFRPAPAPSAAARGAAEQALRTAINGRQRRRTVRPALIVAFLLAAVIVTAAYAVVREVILGAPAPPSVTQVERRLSGPVRGLLIGRMRSVAPGIEVDKTIAAAVATSPDGPAYLWVAPDRGGGYCAFLQVVAVDLPGGRPNLTGGCNVTGRISVAILGVGVHPHRPFVSWLQAYASLPDEKTLDVHYADGTARTYPITNDFVLAFLGPLTTVSSAVVLDAHDRVLAVYRSPVRPARQARVGSQPDPSLSSAHMHVVATIREYGTHRLIIERGDTSRNCHRVAVPWQLPYRLPDGHLLPHGGRVVTGDLAGCGQPPAPDAVMVNPGQVGPAPTGIVLLSGSVGTDIHSLELLFQDGTHVDLPIHQGYVLYQINPKNYLSAHRPTELVARDGGGHIVYARKLIGFIG